VLITDAGSGAPSPVPDAIGLIRAISKACDNELFYFYGGGVRNAKDAGSVVNAGAHGVQIGNAFEEQTAFKKIKEISTAIRKEGKKRV